MVLGPGRSERCPRTVQDRVGPLTQPAGRLPFDFLRVVEVDFPVARGASSESTWRYMMASARASYGERRWTAMSSGKSGGQVRSEIETTGAGSEVAISSSAAAVARTTDARTFATSAAVAATSRRALS